MIPFTPISEELLRPEWVEEEYPVLAEAYSRGDLSEEWKVSLNTNKISWIPFSKHSTNIA